MIIRYAQFSLTYFIIKLSICSCSILFKLCKMVWGFVTSQPWVFSTRSLVKLYWRSFLQTIQPFTNTMLSHYPYWAYKIKESIVYCQKLIKTYTAHFCPASHVATYVKNATSFKTGLVNGARMSLSLVCSLQSLSQIGNCVTGLLKIKLFFLKGVFFNLSFHLVFFLLSKLSLSTLSPGSSSYWI